MAKFTHYLVTRFNVPVERWQRDKSGHTTLDDAWFDHRLDLFSTYCLPSVLHQTNQNFQWLIYCDQGISPSQLLKLSKLIADETRFTIRMADSLESMLADLRQLISQAGTPYVITSRLDNDDAIVIDFIQDVQSHFKEEDKILLHFDDGIAYDCIYRIATRMQTKVHNTFTSLVERTSAEMLTIYGFHHTAIPASVEIMHIPGGEHWLKVIHDRNLRSRLAGIPIQQIPGKKFGIDSYSLIRISWLNTMKYLMKRLGKNYFSKKR